MSFDHDEHQALVDKAATRDGTSSTWLGARGAGDRIAGAFFSCSSDIDAAFHQSHLSA